MPDQCFRINSPSVIHEKFDDELVAINLDTGVYHSLAGAAADAFQLLTETATQNEVAEALSCKYAAEPDTIRAALTPFFVQLQKEDLICAVEPAEGRAQPRLATEESGLPFVAPTLEAYRDLQSLFLLDPVHEVSEEGWPERAAESAQE